MYLIQLEVAESRYCFIWKLEQLTAVSRSMKVIVDSSFYCPKGIWRRVWDSNPRGSLAPGCVQDSYNSPLCQPSIEGLHSI